MRKFRLSLINAAILISLISVHSSFAAEIQDLNFNNSKDETNNSVNTQNNILPVSNPYSIESLDKI